MNDDQTQKPFSVGLRVSLGYQKRYAEYVKAVGGGHAQRWLDEELWPTLAESINRAIKEEEDRKVEHATQPHLALGAKGELLAEHDRLTAEVERMRPLAAVGAAVERMPMLNDRGVELVKLVYSHLDHTWFVTEHYGEIVGGKEGRTLPDALRAAGLMEVGDET